MNEINYLKIEQRPITSFDEDANDDVELGLALLGLSAAQLSRSAKTAFADSTEETSDKALNLVAQDNKDWGYMGTAMSSSKTDDTRFDPNGPKPPFDGSFDPNDIPGMIRKFQEMLAWMKANNMNLNALPEFLAFFENMGAAWKDMSTEDRAKFNSVLNQLLSANGGSICKMIIDAMVEGAFARSGGDKEVAKQMAKDLMNIFAGYSYIDNPWFQRFFDAAKWAYDHVDELKPGLSYDRWVIVYEGLWGRFLNDSNGDQLINSIYQQQIAEIMKLGNPELIVLMLIMLMTNRDDDAQDALGGLGALSDRLAKYVDKIRELSADFRAGNWNAEKAKEFCEALEEAGFLISNNPNLDGIKGQVDGALGYFLNAEVPLGDGQFTTVGALMKEKDFAKIAAFFESQTPNPTKTGTDWNFYNGANQALSDLGSSLSSISQLTGQTMNTLQGTNQQREGLISAFFKGREDQINRALNNMRSAR